MKIRSGFVSNSSSSSFLMTGFEIPVEDVIGTLSILTNKTKKELTSDAEQYCSQKNISEDNFYDYCLDCLYDLNYEEDGFDIFVDDNLDWIIVGKIIGNTYNNETMEISKSIINDRDDKIMGFYKRIKKSIEDEKLFLKGMRP